jgi:hypothetical protein
MSAAEKHGAGSFRFRISFFAPACGALRLTGRNRSAREFRETTGVVTQTADGKSRFRELPWLAPYAQEAGRLFPFSENVLAGRCDLREET